MPATPTWRLPEGCDVLMRAWDEEVVVFHTCSGDTHLVDELGATILECLRETPMNMEALVSRLEARFSFSQEEGASSQTRTDDMLKTYIARFLDDFRRRGLIELST